MFQRRSSRSAPRSRSLALGGALAAVAVVGGGTAVAVTAPTQVGADEIRLTQNEAVEQGAEQAADREAAPQQMPLGVPVDLDLEPVVARAAGGQIPAGTEVQVTGLPDGLVQDGWVISGTPTRAGEYEVLVTVSNSGISRSQKVAITVVEDAGAGAAAETTTTQSDPTLSAVPGDESRGDGAAGAAGAGEDEGGDNSGGGDGVGGDDADGGGDDAVGGDEDEVGTVPDLCAVLGDGQLDGSSLTELLPAVVGGDDAGTAGLVTVLAGALVNLLPSVLGEGGSLEDLGSAGQFLCTLSPTLLGLLESGAETPAQ